MSRDEVPLKRVEILPNLKRYAEEHGLVIDFHFMKKIKWMEEHGGVCFCAHKSDRRCPCDHIPADMKQYNGSCLCSVLNTPECYARVLKRRNRKNSGIQLSCNVIMRDGVIHDLDYKQKQNAERNKNKRKEAETIWNKIKKG